MALIRQTQKWHIPSKIGLDRKINDEIQPQNDETNVQ